MTIPADDYEARIADAKMRQAAARGLEADATCDLLEALLDRALAETFAIREELETIEAPLLEATA